MPYAWAQENPATQADIADRLSQADSYSALIKRHSKVVAAIAFIYQSGASEQRERDRVVDSQQLAKEASNERR